MYSWFSNRIWKINYAKDGANQFEWYPQNDGLHLYNRTSGKHNLTILNNGNIGIGTTVPSQCLEINDGNGVDGTSLIEFNDRAWVGYSLHSLYLKSGSGKNMIFATDGDNEVMRINTYGKVGIGTTTPTDMLTVAGNIHGREVKVTVDAGSVPDFVFEETYPIKNIEEVEAFVKENKHLPEIPSAKEIGENGLQLGEMNLKLLQKIEELTLYLIELNKRVKTLEEENKELKSK
ncbi:MAG: hypothetical protein HC831_22350 [Chloroflexia bacterium]|nr:hypothetical protein [Chloroflexia bacterium]